MEKTPKEPQLLIPSAATDQQNPRKESEIACHAARKLQQKSTMLVCLTTLMNSHRHHRINLRQKIQDRGYSGKRKVLSS